MSADPTYLNGDANLLARYELEDTNDSKGTNHLTNANSVGFVAGLFNNCADLGNTNTNKELYVETNFGQTPTGAISISFWGKMQAEIASGIQIFCGFFLGGNPWRSLKVHYNYNGGARTVQFLLQGNGAITVDKTITLGTAAWYHFCLTYSGGTTGTLKGYLNGEYVGSAGPASITNEVTGLADKLTIGSYYEGSYISAFIDNFKIFSRVLTDAEVSEMALGGASAIKTILGLTKASAKTVNGLAIASVKTKQGLA